MVLKPVIRSPINPVVRGIRGGYSSGLLNRTYLIAYYRGVTDTIGLSVDDYDDLVYPWQDVFFTNPTTPVNFADYDELWTAVSAVPTLNVNYVIGTEEKGVAIYKKTTRRTALNKALAYFGVDQTTNFILSVRTTGTSETVALPASSGLNNFTIDWGDGSTEETVTSANPSHVYSIAGDYTISISGTCPEWSMQDSAMQAKVIAIHNLGATGIVSLDRAFCGCTNLVVVSFGNTDTSAVNNVNQLFDGATSLAHIADIEYLDTSDTTSFSAMFRNCSSLTTPPDVSGFDTSNVTNFGNMFYNCASIITPPDVSGFDTSNVTSFYGMFRGCSSLTTPPDVSGFDTSNVTNFSGMFRNCSSLITAPDVSGFDTSSATSLADMFYNCASIITPPDVSGFDISGLDSTAALNNFCVNLALATVVYDATLVNWASQTVLSGLTPHFGTSKYTAGGAAEAARVSLINDDGWTITDGGAA